MNKFIFFIAIWLVLLDPSHGYCLQNNYNDAKEEYERYVNQGIAVMYGVDHMEAIEKFWQAIYLIPEIPDAYIDLAIAHIYLNEIDIAIRILHKADDVATVDYPRRDMLYYNLAVCYESNFDYSRALEYYSKAIRANEYFGEAMLKVGVVYQKMGQEVKSFAALVKARDIFNRFADVKNVKRCEELLSVGYDKGIHLEIVDYLDDYRKLLTD